MSLVTSLGRHSLSDKTGWMGRCSEQQHSAPRGFSGREKMTSCFTILLPCFPDHERLYLKTMSPNKHFSLKFLSQLLCHNRKKCYLSPGAITLSARLKPSSTGGFLPQGFKGNDIPALRCLKQREMRVPQGTLEHLVTDRIFVSYGKHPCIHTTGSIVGPLGKKKCQTIC